MKEATGELNMTVVTVVAIAAVGAFFYLLIWPTIRSSITRNTKCANAICNSCTGNTCSCQYFEDNGTATPLTCPNKNNS